MSVAEKVIEKRLRGERLNLEDGILLYEADLMLLGRAAKEIRNRLHPENCVTFIVDRNIYYTNVCVADCGFCAFFRRPGHNESYTLDREEIFKKIRALIEIGGTQVLIQGGLNPELRLSYYVDLVRSIKEAFPQIHIHSFSPPEIDIIAKLERMTYQEVLSALKEAGLNSLPGGGAEMLVDRVRNIISPKKISAENWLKVLRAAHEVGLKTTASMVFGHVETIEERIIHLLKLRDLQDETGGIRAFITWSMSTKGTPSLEHLPMASGEDYLRTVAVSRLMLDNIPSIQAGWVTEGHKLAQVALEFGANDMGGTLMEELVIEPTGIKYRTAPRDLIRLIERGGYQAAQRNTNYQIIQYCE